MKLKYLEKSLNNTGLFNRVIKQLNSDIKYFICELKTSFTIRNTNYLFLINYIRIEFDYYDDKLHFWIFLYKNENTSIRYENFIINEGPYPFINKKSFLSIIKSLVKPTTKICKIGNLLITELHPIYEKEWIYPKDSKNVSFYPAKDLDLEYVYSIAIDHGYGIKIDDIFVITLAHGINDHKILTHDYYGTRCVLDDYDEIMNKYPNTTCIGFDPRINKIIPISDN
jgi:hypothetical protein